MSDWHPGVFALSGTEFRMRCVFVALFIFSFAACKGDTKALRLEPVADQPYTVEQGGEVDPISASSASVQKGGTYTTWGGPYPKSLNYWLDSWHISGEIMGLLFESLIGLHSTKNRPVGILAKSWKKSPDKKTFTFQIHPEARWSDGKAVRAVDVQFYYDTILNPKHRTTPVRVLLNRFERPEVLGERTVRIKAKKRYWKAFWDAGFFTAFPKHIWQGKNFNRINFDFPVVNGPYEMVQIKRNRYALLRRRADWWGRILRYQQNKYNFDYIRYRFMEDRTTALEAFKKGDFDLYPVYTSSLWVQQSNFEAVKKNWVVRQEIYNKEPKSFQGFAINLRRARFQDIRVRQALCHLLDRKLMNAKLMFNQYFLLNSYFPDLYPKNINPKVPHCNYDPPKAAKLLDQAAWKVGPQGTRLKNGQPFSLSFLTYAADLRHTNIYVEALKKAGIDARIEQLSHATVSEKVDNFKFDLHWINTSGSRLRDPESLFHSRYANEIATSNITGLQDSQVDALLEKLKSEENLEQRNRILRALDLRLMKLYPYVLLWQADKSRLLYWKGFGSPKYVLDKYNRENAVIVYWWLDSQKAKNLAEARKKGLALPKEAAKVYYGGP